MVAVNVGMTFNAKCEKQEAEEVAKAMRDRQDEKPSDEKQAGTEHNQKEGHDPGTIPVLKPFPKVACTLSASMPCICMAHRRRWRRPGRRTRVCSKGTQHCSFLGLPEELARRCSLDQKVGACRTLDPTAAGRSANSIERVSLEHPCSQSGHAFGTGSFAARACNRGRTRHERPRLHNAVAVPCRLPHLLLLHDCASRPVWQSLHGFRSQCDDSPPIATTGRFPQCHLPLSCSALYTDAAAHARARGCRAGCCALCALVFVRPHALSRCERACVVALSATTNSARDRTSETTLDSLSTD